MKLIIVTSIALFLMMIGSAQGPNVKKAYKKFDDNAYLSAAKKYEKIVALGYKSEELFKKLGDIHYFKANYIGAEKWYQELYNLNNNLGVQYLLRFSQSLKAVGKEKEAEKMYNGFLNEAGVLDEELSSSSDYMKIIAKDGLRYQIKALSLNSKGTDYGAFLQDDLMYFSSSRNLKRRIGVDTWSNEAFLDIYTIGYDQDGNIHGKPKAIKGKVNTKFHESSSVITKDGSTMYFTGTNKNKNHTGRLKIYCATKVGNKWGNIEDLSINGDDFSNAHPVLGLNENRLYFSSNMPGSLGQTDLFYATINADGTLGKPINLGKEINTKGRESFPYITADNELYFSSDGHLGFGGYDVYYIDLNVSEMHLLNIGEPVNSAADDFAFSIDNNTKKGFFSTNREKVDNIYSITETRPIGKRLEVKLKGVVIDKSTGKPIKDAVVAVTNVINDKQYNLSTNENGVYEIAINKFKEYTITVAKKGFEIVTYFIEKGQDSHRKDFQLVGKASVADADVKVEQYKFMEIGHIHFDFNSFNLRDKSKEELKKISVLLEQQPELKVEILAHTDSRGEEAYNIWLSEERARRTRQFLLESKIDRFRININGYGESKLLNDCVDNVDCKPEEHQLNRRVEFIIVGD